MRLLLSSLLLKVLISNSQDSRFHDSVLPRVGDRKDSMVLWPISILLFEDLRLGLGMPPTLPFKRQRMAGSILILESPGKSITYSPLDSALGSACAPSPQICWAQEFLRELPPKGKEVGKGRSCPEAHHHQTLLGRASTISVCPGPAGPANTCPDRSGKAR